MGQLYVLKLQSDKWYVGYTDRGIVRVLEHLQNAGKFKAAKWTQKYRPINWEDAVVEVTGGNKTLEDEDNKTLELMAIHGVENVRGGKWCKVNMTKREIEKLTKSIGGIVNLNKLPDAIFVVDLANESTAITEAQKLGIPVIGLADSNVDPEGVEIVIPGNDDAIRSIELIASAIADACLKGSGKRSEVENKENE